MELGMKNMQHIKAIIGLGNPGPKFIFMRHNIGFRVVDALAEKYGATWTTQKNYEIASIQIGPHLIQLIKPQTFMNNSGEIIPDLIKKGIKPENILVVHDELEKPFGTLTFKADGSARGHNGLRSLIERGGLDFARLRFGIGRPENKEMVGDYVLHKFTEPQHEIDQLIDQAIAMIENIFSAKA